MKKSFVQSFRCKNTISVMFSGFGKHCKIVRRLRLRLRISRFIKLAIAFIIILSSTSCFSSNLTDATAEFIDYAETSVRSWRNASQGREDVNLNLEHSFVDEAIIPLLFVDFQRLTREQIRERYAVRLNFINKAIEKSTVDNYDLTELLLALKYSIGSVQEIKIVDKLIDIIFYHRLTSASKLLDIVRYKLKIEQDCRKSKNLDISLRPEILDLQYLQSKAVSSGLSIEEIHSVLQIAKKKSLDDKVLLQCSLIMAVAGKDQISANLAARSYLLNKRNLDVIIKNPTLRLIKKNFVGYEKLMSGEYRPSIKSVKYPGIDKVVIEYNYTFAGAGIHANARDGETGTDFTKSLKYKEELKWNDGKYFAVNSKKEVPAGLINRIYSLASVDSSKGSATKKNLNTDDLIKANLKICFKSSYDKREITLDASGIQSYMLPFIVNGEYKKSVSKSVELGKSVYLLMNWLGIKNIINADAEELNSNLGRGMKPEKDSFVAGLKKQLAKFHVWQNKKIIRRHKLIKTKDLVKRFDSYICNLRQKVTGAEVRLVKYKFSGVEKWFGMDPSSYLATIDEVYSRLQFILDMKINSFDIFAPTSAPFAKYLPNLLSMSRSIKILSDYNLPLSSLGKCLFPLKIKCKSANLILSAIYLTGSQEILISKLRRDIPKNKSSRIANAIYKRILLPEILALEIRRIEFDNGKIILFIDNLVKRSDIQAYINRLLGDVETRLSSNKLYSTLTVNLKDSAKRINLLIDANNTVSIR